MKALTVVQGNDVTHWLSSSRPHVQHTGGGAAAELRREHLEVSRWNWTPSLVNGRGGCVTGAEPKSPWSRLLGGGGMDVGDGGREMPSTEN